MLPVPAFFVDQGNGDPLAFKSELHTSKHKCRSRRRAVEGWKLPQCVCQSWSWARSIQHQQRPWPLKVNEDRTDHISLRTRLNERSVSTNFWVFPSLYACTVWFEMFDLRAIISADVLLPYPEGVSGLGVVDLASLKLPMGDLNTNAASHP